MINTLLICKTNHWPARFKKINNIVNDILYFKKKLHFNSNINYYCNIILSDDKFIKQMNSKFRNKKNKTDVLTFVSEVNLPNEKKQKICDIILSANTIKNDAIKNKIAFYSHLTHILIHSFLHINNYDHKNNNEFVKMKKLEVSILNKMGIKNPYLIN